MAFKRQVKNFVKHYSDAEIKVREATSNDPWGPSSSLMLDICDLTFNTISLAEIMNMLWHRLNDHGKNWRHVYKSLTLMDYLIKNGSRKVIQHCRERFCNLQTLKEFQHIDEAGKDQGYYIREKSKQVISLLMDEQLLYKEREVACRTRRRTSYSMAFPQNLPAMGNSPTSCASAPTPETPAFQSKRKLLKAARLRHKKNTSKAGSKQEQCQHPLLPSGTTLSQETLPVKITAWDSTEDLILFYDDDPKPPLPTRPPSTASPAMGTSDVEAEVRNPWDADATPTPSEKSPSLQTDVSLGQTSDSTLRNTVLANPSQAPLAKQPAARSFEAATTLPGFGSASKEEWTGPDVSISKSGSVSQDQASVETLYVSPSFQTFDSVEGAAVISQDAQEAAPSGPVQVDEEDGQPLTIWVSTASEGASSFSTFSASSPDSASPEKSVHVLSSVLAEPSFWTLSHQPSYSASLRDKDKTARVHHPFSPRSTVSSDEEENANLHLLEGLPDGADPANNQTRGVPGTNSAELSTPNVDHFTSLSSASSPIAKVLPREPESNRSIHVLLGEVRSAIGRLHKDLSTVIQELHTINCQLGSLSGSSQQISTSLQSTQSSEGSSDQS
ncbi:ENTH domain-containing protein 1 [Echinops telfairi]|uniref:ENTH domain-containing protein 1 n=1 Tax=Echinops telfairi TaxID=9371 RepID=A0ABM0IIF6_ECHTE|nr:ENTH domain-containing protein 1 [Echinops telfairi]